METVSLSEVGGLTTEILARMGQGLAILTSDKVARAVVLPHTSNRQDAIHAATRYTLMTNDDDNTAVRVGRLKGRLQTKLTSHGQLLVLRRGEPVAILLPPPGDKESAERGAMSYLEALGIVINST